MRRFRILVASCLVAGALLLAPGPVTGAAHGWSAPRSTAGSEYMIKKINNVLRVYGLRRLRFSRSLGRSSFRYADWMMRRDYFGHRSRISASRRFRSLGEVIAIHWGRRLQVGSTLRRWLRSSGHRRILLSPRFTWAGAGHRRGRFRGSRATTWVVHVGRL
jgi:uncharacterized protein YkwD